MRPSIRTFLRDKYLRIIGSITNPKSGIHIINSHFITPYKAEQTHDTLIFEEYLNYLQKISDFITLEQATEKILKRESSNKIFVAFTFDDGFEECYTTIAPLLEKYNTRGAFFINSAYIESNKEYQQIFNKRINTYTKKPMTWEQIIELHNRGHIIGSHNVDHSNFSEMTEKEIEESIKQNKQILEEKLNYKCDFFAWTYGNLKHFPESALPIVQKYHSFIYSATNYKNYFSLNKQVINRRHIEAFWPKSHINYFLSFKKSF